MTKDLYRLAEQLQEQLRATSSLQDAPRVLLDAWASLYRWHGSGERVWRISPAAADETADMLLPPELPLATARVRAEAVCYQGPERGEWIILARHAPAPCEIMVYAPLRWAYRQPLLTYCTESESGELASGYYSLADYPTAGSLPDRIRPGTALGLAGARTLGDTATTEEEARVALALLHHYLP